MSGSPAAPGPCHNSVQSSPAAPSYRQLLLLTADSPGPSPSSPPSVHTTPSSPPLPPPAPAPNSQAAQSPPPEPTHYFQPPPPSGPPPPASPRVAINIAAGSAAGAVLLVLLLALGLYQRTARRKRRAGRGEQERAAADSSGPSGSSRHQSTNMEPPTSPAGPFQQQKRRSAELTTTPRTATSGSSSSATATTSSSASSRERQKAERRHGVPRMLGGGDEVLFKGAFTYEELAAATDGFSESNLIGRGGFGDVYVGTVHDGGTAVAVKRLRAGSQQGDREFQAELQIISRVHHRNLVSLVGYCVGDGGQRLLVYEFVPNMTLQHHLHDAEVETVLDWKTRWKIAVGAAKGLAYLHEDCHPRIIHRDIKSANILLDPDFNPKVSDFGMAKFVPRGGTHIATRIVGTIGYLAPEYASSGRLTEKSDVFSFGVVLLELLTGMNVAMSSDPDDREGTLVGWARPLLTQALELRNYDELVDPLLICFDAEQMARLVRCAVAAVSTSARHRPRMSQIVRHLEGDASAEEIEACGIESTGETGSTIYGPATSVQFRPVRYSQIRMSRREARAKKIH